MDLDLGNQLIDIAIELIQHLYVHLPLKRSMYAVNPIQRLRLLKRRHSATQTITQRQFYNEMLSIFSQMRDLHTAFVLPEPFRSATAFLPFRLEACIEGEQRKYLVSEVMAKAPRHPGFRRGVEVTHWNGVAIEKAVAVNAEREAGSNAAARHAQGLASMTIRWLGQSLPPDEDWVDITFRPVSSRVASKARTARFTWRVFRQEEESGAEHEVARAGGLSPHVGMDSRGEMGRLFRHYHFGKFRGASPTRRSRVRDVGEVTSFLDDVFTSCRTVRTSYGQFAYIRIATFNVEDDTAFLEEFIRIAGALSQDGMILDVRGNVGGLIHAGERLLQLLTPRPIEPCRFHFLNSTRTEKISQRRVFRAWNESIAQAVETGAEYSQGLPLLPPAAYNDLGQKYQGPVVLVTDALCYSTTDIFAAGFQDNQIGMVLGVDAYTGAGGANVWEYALISDLLRRPGQFPGVLSGGASFRFAVRRATRVGRASGLPLEDFGVRADELHKFTRDDVLKRNVDLIARAAQLLGPMQKQSLIAKFSNRARNALHIECSNIDRVDAYLDERPLTYRIVKSPVFDLAVPSRRAGQEIRLRGFRKGELVAATRVRLR